MARQRPRKTQPVRAPSGGPYGQRSQLESAQRAIPLPASEGTTGAAPPGPAGTPPPPVSAGGTPATPPPAVVPPTPPDLYAPADPNGPGFADPLLPEDPAEFLRAVYTMFPSPGLRALIERASRR